MPQPSAETAYEFRHATLRDAAYQMQLPSERSVLHRAALLALHSTTPPEQHRLIAAEQVVHANAALTEGEDTEVLRLQLEYLIKAAEHASQNYDGTASGAYSEQILAHPMATRDQKLVITHQHSATLLHLGKGREAEALLRSKLEGSEPLGDHHHGRLTGALAGVLSETGSPQEALELYEKAIELNRSAVDSYYLGISLTNRAILLRHLAHDVDAEALLNEALNLHRSNSNTLFEGITEMALGGARRTLEDNESAEKHYLRAAQIFEARGGKRELAQVMGNLANVYLAAARLDEAEQAYLYSLRVAREIGLRRSEALIMGNLSSLLADRGRFHAAVSAAGASVDILVSLNDRMLLPAFRAMYGSNLARIGLFERAEHEFTAAESELTETSSIAVLDHLIPMQFRFRIAQAFGGFGPGRNPASREPKYLDQADALLQRLREGNKSTHAGMTKVLNKSVVSMAETLTAARERMAEGRGPWRLNNSNLEIAQTEYRAALHAWLTHTCPDQLKYMQEQLPDMHRQLVNDIENVPVPDWRGDALPV